jgi:hypothetical protein
MWILCAPRFGQSCLRKRSTLHFGFGLNVICLNPRDAQGLGIHEGSCGWSLRAIDCRRRRTSARRRQGRLHQNKRQQVSVNQMQIFCALPLPIKKVPRKIAA